MSLMISLLFDLTVRSNVQEKAHLLYKLYYTYKIANLLSYWNELESTLPKKS